MPLTSGNKGLEELFTLEQFNCFSPFGGRECSLQNGFIGYRGYGALSVSSLCFSSTISLAIEIQSFLLDTMRASDVFS
jgi:hypothetical protein